MKNKALTHDLIKFKYTYIYINPLLEVINQLKPIDKSYNPELRIADVDSSFKLTSLAT